ncbi:hypothetical protein K1719_030318 [Acacia pycnantha]|nr:hypothetical protein K1719_030318 [Acacia pycnantha]
MKVPVKEIQVVNKHDENSTRDQNQIKKTLKGSNENEGRRRTCLLDFMNPVFSVLVLKAQACSLRTMKVPVKEKEVVTKHNDQSTRDQNQIKIYLCKRKVLKFKKILQLHIMLRI